MGWGWEEKDGFKGGLVMMWKASQRGSLRQGVDPKRQPSSQSKLGRA